MKKFKLIIIGVAIVFALGSAYATRPCQACTFYDQYYKSGNFYIPAGSLGNDYTCVGTIGICTYYQPNPILQPNYYAPCRVGTYTVIQ